MDLISTYAVGVGEVDAEGQPPLDPADQIRLDRVRLEELSTVPERQHRAPDAASILDALRDNTSFENIVFGSRILVWESRDARPAHLVILASPWDREQHKWSASLVLGELKRRRQVPIPPGEVTLDDLPSGARKNWSESDQQKAVAYLNSPEGAAAAPTRWRPAFTKEQLGQVAADLEEATLALGRSVRSTLFLPRDLAPLFPFFPLIFPGRVESLAPDDPDFAVAVGCDSGDVATAEFLPVELKFSIGVDTRMKLAWLDPEEDQEADADQEAEGMKGRHDIRRTCYVSTDKSDQGVRTRVVFQKPLALMAYTKGANSCGSKVWLTAQTVPVSPGGSVLGSPKTSLSKLLHLDANLSDLSYRLDDHNYLGNDPGPHATVSYTIYLVWGLCLGPEYTRDQLHYKFDELAHFFQDAVHSPDTESGQGLMRARKQVFHRVAKKQRLGMSVA